MRMPLRRRLLLALVGSGVLLVAATAGVRQMIVRRSNESTLRSVLEARVDAIGRERCEEGLLPFGPPPRRPRGEGPGGEGPGGPPPGMRPRRGERERRPIEVFFYGTDFGPRRGGPAFPPSAAEGLRNGESFVVVSNAEGGSIGAVATGWDSARCAYATAFLPPPPPLLPLPTLALGTLGLLGALAGAIYLAAASPVRRIRSLAEAVRASVQSRYATRVPAEGNDEIADLAGAFDEAAGAVRSQLVAVEKREAVLRDFVAHTTHDVGLPLSVLAGHLSEMRERVGAARPVDPALVAAAAQETQYIASLLHNLGAVARLETEDALREKHPVDLGALLERVVLRHSGLARDAGVEMNHGVPETAVTALGDVTLLEQALNNLVHNAIRYNRAGGHVAVVLDGSAARFELSVSDDGPGVTDAELPRLGEAHFRGGDARSRRPEGRGLGLSIAMAVAQRHGFELSFRRAEAGGLVARLSGARA